MYETKISVSVVIDEAVRDLSPHLLIHNHHVMAANMANAFSLDYYSVLGMYNVRSPKYTLIVGLTT